MMFEPPRESRILAAVSGGPDSMALLYWLAERRRTHSLVVEAAHLHHGIRGEEADEDARFVKEHCRKLSIPCKIFRFDVPRFAKRLKLSLEEAGRRARRHFLFRYARGRKMDFVALAHTADDRAETVFMNMARGAGPGGISSMRLNSGGILRPLLSWTREEVMSYLLSGKIDYRIDSSNFDAKFLRNRIRHEIFPWLKRQLSVDFRETLSRLGEIQEEDEVWIESVVLPVFLPRFRKEAEGIHALALKAGEFPAALERRLVRMFFRETVGLSGLTFEVVERARRLLHQEKGKCVVVKNARVESSGGGLIVLAEKPVSVAEIPILVPGETRIDGLQLRLESTLLLEPGGTKGGKSEAFLDYRRLAFPLSVRTRKNGDAFFPAGSPGVKKLQDYFVDRKIPRYLRDRIPLVTSPKGIVWVAGYDLDERYRVSRQTREVLCLKVVHE